jgi:hypothetical protein
MQEVIVFMTFLVQLLYQIDIDYLHIDSYNTFLWLSQQKQPERNR